MKKQFRTVLATLFIIGMIASCSQSDVDELDVKDIQAQTESSVEGTGGGAGGDPKGD